MWSVCWLINSRQLEQSSVKKKMNKIYRNKEKLKREIVGPIIDGLRASLLVPSLDHKSAADFPVLFQFDCHQLELALARGNGWICK